MSTASMTSNITEYHTSRIPFILICFLSFLIPLRRLYSVGPLSIGGIVGLFAIISWIAYMLFYNEKRPNLKISTNFYVFFTIFISWATLSIVWSSYRLGSILFTLEYVKLFFISIVIFNVINNHEDINHILIAFVGGAAIVSISVWINVFFGEQVLTGRYGAFGFSLNRTVGHLAVSIPISWYLFGRYYKRNKSIAYAFFIYSPIGMIAIIATGSRQGLLALIPFLIYLGFKCFGWRENIQYLIYIFLITTMVISLAFLELSIERLQTTFDTIATGEFGGRGMIWSVGIGSVYERGFQTIILGHGIGQFGPTVEPILGRPRGPHNTYIRIFVELGLVGICLFILILGNIISKVRSFPNTPIWLTALSCLLIVGIANDWGPYLMTWFVFTIVITQNSLQRVAKN